MEQFISDRDRELIDEFVGRLKSWRHSRNQVQAYTNDLNAFGRFLSKAGGTVETASPGNISAFLKTLENEVPRIQYRNGSIIKQFYSYLTNDAEILAVDPADEVEVADPQGDPLALKGPGFADEFSPGDMVRLTYIEGDDPNAAPIQFEGVLKRYIRGREGNFGEFLALDDGRPIGDQRVDMRTVVSIDASGPTVIKTGIDGAERYILKVDVLAGKDTEDHRPKNYVAIQKDGMVGLDAIEKTTTSDGRTPSQRLQELSKTLEQGLITEAEFDEKRKQIIAEI